jgi:hypothetical protein
MKFKIASMRRFKSSPEGSMSVVVVYIIYTISLSALLLSGTNSLGSSEVPLSSSISSLWQLTQEKEPARVFRRKGRRQSWHQ